MRFLRSSSWLRAALVILLAGLALELAFLTGAWPLFSLLGILGVWGVWGARKKATLPALFLLGMVSFLHFSLLPLWILQVIVLLSIWMVFELYWRAWTERAEALVYVTAFLLSLSAWDMAVRDLLPFYLSMTLFALAMTLLSGLRLKLSGEPSLLAFIFGLFVAINLAEIFFILGFWPVAVAVKSVILLLAFYLQLSLLLAAWAGKVTLRKALKPIIITVAAAVIIFLTTEWYPFV